MKHGMISDRGLIWCFVLLTGLFFLFSVPTAYAADEETVARNFLTFLQSDKIIISGEIIERNQLDPTLAPVAVAHLFRLKGGGYILVSTNRSISPIKAYSLISDFTALPENYRKAILAELELRVRTALSRPARVLLEAERTETEVRWDFLLNINPDRLQAPYMPDTHLIQTRWNQDYPYNKFLPVMANGQTVVAGCVNVAVAQIMRYHRYPASSQGVISYEWNGQTLKTVLYRGYNWNNMPEVIDASTPEYLADEVALLMKDLGIANRTSFDSTGSSTFLYTSALFENFGYSTGLAQRDNADFSAFLSTIQNEIQAERPLLITFPGHMAVADGYSSDNAGQKIHINMGWGGTADDFYFLDQTVQAGSYNFPAGPGQLTIYYNIKPCGDGDCATNSSPAYGAGGIAISDSFTRPEESHNYQVYMKGDTTVSVNSPYANIAFFLSMYTADNSLLTEIDGIEPKNVSVPLGNLPAGKYLIRADLCNSAVGCYSPPNAYTITLTTGLLTDAERLAVDQSLDKPPVISNLFPGLVLNAAVQATEKILIDARDENGDPVVLSIGNSNPAAVGTVLNGSVLELTPAGTAKVASRIVVSAEANGKAVEKAFTVMTDNVDTAFGASFAVNGTFINNTDDFHRHRVILDGDCTIQGDNGFTTQGFYSSVLDVDGNDIIPADSTEINATFAQAIYQLGAALYKNVTGGIYYFPYEPGAGDTYVLKVNCPAADTASATIAALLGIDLSGTELPLFPPGDVNGDSLVNLADAVLTLHILTGVAGAGSQGNQSDLLQADVNGDGKIGLAELIFILQKTATLR